MALVAIPVIPPLVIPPATGNPRVFLGERTGAGPWEWDTLDGDEVGLRSYEIVGRWDKAAVAARSLAIQFSGDTAANYMDPLGVAVTSARIGSAFAGSMQGTIRIPAARSTGDIRCVTGELLLYNPSAPEVLVRTPDGAWLGPGNITSITLINSVGTCDSGVWALFKLMDVP